MLTRSDLGTGRETYPPVIDRVTANDGDLGTFIRQ